MAPHAKSGAIQALRALAISVVLGFHLDSSFIPNGFLGVDMFFVISGFLMTMILTRSGVTTSSTRSFFERRIKRIVPLYALTVVLVLCAGKILLIAKDYRILQTDAIWALGIGSNMQSLFHVYDYFEELTAFKLLTHTWSLAVELQYYLFVPLLMLILLRLPFKSRTFVACLLLAMSWSLQYSMDPSVGFGLLPCRVWQFLCGLIAYNLSHNEQSGDTIQEIKTGKVYTRLEPSETNAFLLGDVSGTDSDTEEKKDEKAETTEEVPEKKSVFLPSLFAHIFFILSVGISFVSTGNGQADRAIATVFAGLLIYFSTYGPTVLLDKWLLQYVGDISYILYLSHWPIIVLLKYISPDEKLSTQAMFLAVLLSVAISCVIHHTLEQQFIVNGIKYALIWISILYLLSFTLIVIPAPDEADVVIRNGNSTKDCAALIKNVPYPKLENYSVQRGGYQKYGEDHGNGTFDVLLIGNSFMRMAFPWFHKALEGRYRKLITYSSSTCLPFLNHSAVHDRGIEYCFKDLQRDLTIACTLRPRIIFMSIGWRMGFHKKKFQKQNDTYALDAIQQLKKYSNCSEFIVLDTPFQKVNGIADRLQKAVKLHKPPPPKNESQFTYDSFLRFHDNTFQRIEMLRRNCPKCHFVEVQSEFCDGYMCNTFDYDCGQTFYTGDGVHMTTFAKNFVYHRYKAEIDTVLRLAEDMDIKDKKRK